ncbi:hypothetical protein FGM00_00215 [Aggregatimonas sangjinii]|uniref:Uncharacterized protein n=1 Tax=Aggregatimonas sangjinii TaxID=2583587 RepID=A0A5B7SMI6_9FLAO|nr:hypothetical protein [Aggregatimonas sangjinii]QCW98618.1 hypothetical protein FGM00_00215 [Aggregatimonas sangjinii]
MKKLLCSLVCMGTLLSMVQCQNSTATIPDFKVPKNMQAVKKWPRQGEFWYLQDKISPYTPRLVSATTGPEFNVQSFPEAFKDLESAVDINVKHDPTFEKLDAYEKWDGTDLRISLTPTTYSGVDGVLFLLISKPPKDENYYMIGLEMTAKTYRDWGGVARILTLREIISDPSVFPKERLEQIANAPLDGQVKLYEETVDALQENLLEQMVTLSQMQTIQALQNIQFDQILNNEMTDPFEY